MGCNNGQWFNAAVDNGVSPKPIILVLSLLNPMPNRIVLQLGINITDGYKLLWNMSIRNNWHA